MQQRIVLLNPFFGNTLFAKVDLMLPIRLRQNAHILIPQTVFSCRGSGGLGKDAGARVWPPREYLAVNDTFCQKTRCFLMVFDENADFS